MPCGHDAVAELNELNILISSYTFMSNLDKLRFNAASDGEFSVNNVHKFLDHKSNLYNGPGSNR